MVEGRPYLQVDYCAICTVEELSLFMYPGLSDEMLVVLEALEKDEPGDIHFLLGTI